jgi:hypothetical protein
MARFQYPRQALGLKIILTGVWPKRAGPGGLMARGCQTKGDQPVASKVGRRMAAQRAVRHLLLAPKLPPRQTNCPRRTRGRGVYSRR